ncbi:hypothetical protein TrLO_g10712 [Triparma laevis f. longispina]|uniref:Uncharacterized protein n=1 Tax=Triparma laevis f. longispina TaxID=1714387 RepID=A0A9W7C643_9STRA|nr:hypothetical protein TrLO_g10712 [Triparma laevis f. longispina]
MKNLLLLLLLLAISRLNITRAHACEAVKKCLMNDDLVKTFAQSFKSYSFNISTTITMLTSEGNSTMCEYIIAAQSCLSLNSMCCSTPATKIAEQYALQNISGTNIKRDIGTVQEEFDGKCLDESNKKVNLCGGAGRYADKVLVAGAVAGSAGLFALIALGKQTSTSKLPGDIV